jgi:hypothetical protein
MASSILIKEKVNKNEIEYARNVVSKELLKPKSMLMKTVEENILASKNVGNNVFEFSRTATSLIAVMVITYISSGILVFKIYFVSIKATFKHNKMQNFFSKIKNKKREREREREFKIKPNK